jgi:hypothetical protein
MKNNNIKKVAEKAGTSQMLNRITERTRVRRNEDAMKN